MFEARKDLKLTNKAVLVAVSLGKEQPEEIQEHLDELAFLAESFLMMI